MTNKTAFDFARALRDPIIRARLTGLGFDGEAGDVVVPWVDGETPSETAARAVDARRVLLVMPDPTRPGGWRMGWADLPAENA